MVEYTVTVYNVVL